MPKLASSWKCCPRSRRLRSTGLKLEQLIVPVTDAAGRRSAGAHAGQNQKSYKDAAKTKKAAEGDQLIIDFVGRSTASNSKAARPKARRW